MTSLEGVSHRAVRAAELGDSLSGHDRDWPLLTAVNGSSGGGRSGCVRKSRPGVIRGGCWSFEEGCLCG
jgi:hypothetical protein